MDEWRGGAGVNHWQGLAGHGVDPLAVNQQLQEGGRETSNSGEYS
jgi:hypothetical protein